MGARWRSGQDMSSGAQKRLRGYSNRVMGGRMRISWPDVVLGNGQCIHEPQE